MRAEIISIGTEILLGEILDTNAQYIASRLPALGIDLYWMTKVGDNPGRITEAFRRAWERSDLIISTGGLGPTEDDLTREGIAATLGEEMRLVPELEQELRDFFARRGARMPERNLKQAMLIPSARAIPNPRGTAPGWWVERDGKIIVAMPGPPAEMQRMWEKEVVPELERRPTGYVIISRTVKTAGIGEGTVDEMVSPLLKSANPTIGVYSKADGIHLRLTAKAPTRDEAQRLIEPVEAEVRRILGPAVWGVDDDTLEAAVVRMLTERDLTIATMESCTGGMLAAHLTDVPGASAAFTGGLVTYTVDTKVQAGVDPALIEEHGVISAEVARAMAAVVRERLGTDVGVGITGVAGPDEQEGKPVGTMHVAVDSAGATQAANYVYNQGRDANRRRATTTALLLIRRLLQDREGARPA
jgi:nicotinamide-nucleotide amidase